MKTKEYKLTARKGRNIQVCFSYEPNKWISTGTTDLNEAHRFALSRLGKSEAESRTTIKEFVTTLINTNFEKLKKLDNLHSKEKKQDYYNNLVSLAKRWILPIFGKCIISKLTTKEIDRRIAELKCNNLTKNRIIDNLKIIYKLAILDNLATENIAEKVEKYREKHEETAIFTAEEIRKIFTDNNSLILKNVKWYLYFYFLRDTGWRPSEVLSLRYEDIKDDGGVETSRAVVKGKIQDSIKTANKGFKYRIGIISHFALKLFKFCKIGANPSDFVFLFKGKFPTSQQANRELAKICRENGVEIGARTQYSFRHLFNTRAIGELDEATRLELMGHTKNRREYDHRDGEIQLRKLQQNNEIKKKILALYD